MKKQENPRQSHAYLACSHGPVNAGVTMVGGSRGASPRAGFVWVLLKQRAGFSLRVCVLWGKSPHTEKARGEVWSLAPSHTFGSLLTSCPPPARHSPGSSSAPPPICGKVALSREQASEESLLSEDRLPVETASSFRCSKFIGGRKQHGVSAGQCLDT